MNELGRYGTAIGLLDCNGTPLMCGDVVRNNNESPNTKEEYWNPVYRIEYEAPAYVLKHIGGGKSGGNCDFLLKHGGGNGNLERIRRFDEIDETDDIPSRTRYALAAGLSARDAALVYDPNDQIGAFNIGALTFRDAEAAPAMTALLPFVEWFEAAVTDYTSDWVERHGRDHPVFGWNGNTLTLGMLLDAQAAVRAVQPVDEQGT